MCVGAAEGSRGGGLRTKSARVIEGAGQWSSRGRKQCTHITVSSHAGHYFKCVPHINSFHPDQSPFVDGNRGAEC